MSRQSLSSRRPQAGAPSTACAPPWRHRAALAHAGRVTRARCLRRWGQRSFARSGVRWARRRHPGAAHRCRSAPRGDPARSLSEERRMTLGDIGVAAQPIPPAGPTSSSCSPRRASGSHHPDYPLDDLGRRDPRPLPRPRAGPADRRRGDRAAAAGRARHLGVAARPGGRAGRLRPRAAPRRHGLPDLPGARRRLVPRRRPAAPARSLPRRQPRRLGPEGAATSTSTRSSSAPRPCTRPATRWASSGTAARTP